MKINAQQLKQSLSQGLKPCYLLFGDEPFQVNDCRNNIVEAAKLQGFEEFIRLSSDDADCWPTLENHCQSMSLFASKKLISLELNSKLLKKTTDALKKAASLLSEDTVLLVFGNKLDASKTKSAWFKSLDKIGVYVPVYDIEGRQLQTWLQQQLAERQLSMSQECQDYLLNYTAGNLLACAQTLDKQKMISHSQKIELHELQKVLIDQSRYSVFQLMDQVLASNIDQCIHILTQLKAEEVEPTQILWAMQKDVLILYQVVSAKQANQPTQGIFDKQRIWKSKQSLYLSKAERTSLTSLELAIRLLAKIDQAIKSQSGYCPYSLFCHLCLLLDQPEPMFELPLPLVTESI